MKKIVQLLSILMIICMLGTTTVFAAITTDAAVTITSDKTTVAVGENVTFTFGVSADSKGYYLASNIKIAPIWNTECWDYVSYDITCNTYTPILNVDPLVSEENVLSGKLSFSQSNGSNNTGGVGAHTFLKITLKAKKADSTNITLDSTTVVRLKSPISGESGYAKADTSATQPITITAGGSGSTDIVVDDETFTDVDDSLQTKDETVTSGDVKVNNKTFATMGANGSIKTYFKKNGTGDVLKAGTYGITVTIGETKYKFPGKADVPADKAWAIKLVIPEGKFADNETVGAFGVAEEY